MAGEGLTVPLDVSSDISRLLELLDEVMDLVPVAVGVFEPRAEDDPRLIYANRPYRDLRERVPFDDPLRHGPRPGTGEMRETELAEFAHSGRPLIERDVPIELKSSAGLAELHYFALETRPLMLGQRVVLLNVVTENSGVERHLEREREQLRTVLEVLPVGVFLMDSNGAITYANEASKTVWRGISHSQGPGDYGEYKGWWAETGELIAAEDWAAARALKGETSIGEVIDIERFDGTRGTILNSAAPLLGDEGAIVGAVTVVQDVTVRAQTEQRLRQALEERERLSRQLAAEQRQLNAVFESMAEGVSVWRRDGTLLDMNESNAKIFGFRSKEDLSSDLREMTGVEVRSQGGELVSFVDQPVPRLLRGDTFSDLVLDVYVPSTRKHFTGNFNATSVKAEDDGVILGVLTVRDITKTHEVQERLRRELDTTQLLLGASGALAQWTDLQVLLKALASLVLQAIGHTRVTVGTWDAARRELRVLASVGEKALSPLIAPADKLSPPLRQVVESGETVITDYDALPPEQRRYGDEFDSHLSLQVPLRHRDTVVGVIGVDDPGERREFGEREVQVVQAIAAQAAAAVENAGLFEERTRRAGFAEALNRINDAVHSTLEFDEIMTRVTVEITQALNVDASAVHMHVGTHWEFAHSYNLPEGLRVMRLPDSDASLSMRVMQTQEPLVSNEVQHDERANVKLMERFSITAVIAVPLVVRGESIGVLFTGCTSGVGHFGDEEVDFVRKAAGTLALALQNARLYETERRIADRLQSALLSLPDEIEGIEFAHAYRSAMEAARVGGDFYDIFEVEHGLVGITIGDVAGKGIDAAVLTSLVKNSIRAHANERGKSPSRILELTNDVVYRSTDVESFVTVFFGLLNKTDGRLTYCNAGHTTPMIVHDGGVVEELPATGTIVGAFPGVTMGEATARLGPDEPLLLYSDGLTEARREDGFYGEQRVKALLTSMGHTDADVTVRGVVADVLAYSDGQLRDDLAILAVKRVRPGGEHAERRAVEL